MKKSSKIYIAGHNGMVGSAIVRKLLQEGYNNIIVKSSAELDLRSQSEVSLFFSNEKPKYVFLAAAKVGGILANSSYPADFIYDNLMIQTNIIHQSYINNVKKLLFLGSSCIYPKMTEQPISEKSFLAGYLEPTNEAYAIAKISGIKMCQSYFKQHSCNFICAMPTNLYGYNDNYDLNNSHVLPALIRKIHEAKINNKNEVVVWGSGKPLREFMFVEDLADACVFLMRNYNEVEIINIGTGNEITIKNLAELICKIIAFKGKIIFDESKPDGTPRKLLNIFKLKKLGYVHKINIEDGIRLTYKNFLAKYKK